MAQIYVCFSVLPTAPVALGKVKYELFSNYRQVPWLIRKVSICRLPSVSSLVTLRTLPKGDPSRKAFVGFGDPYFNVEQFARAKEEEKDTGTNKESTISLLDMDSIISEELKSALSFPPFINMVALEEVVK